MLRLLLAILAVSILLGGASAQDWRADDKNETRYNCDLVSALAEAYGGVPLLQSADEGIASLSEFLDLLFPACQPAVAAPEQAAMTDADDASEDATSDGETESNALADGEKKVINGTMCLVWTEAWDVDLNVLVIGEPQDDISVALTFPDQTEPDAMDDIYRSEFDDGQRYRVEWVAGRHFPLGEYSIDVTIEGERYHYTWQREEHEVNTVGVECIDPEEAIPVDEFLAELEAAEAD